ncbi:MAG: HNH endonuclease [Myxococcales bacterium]|nr:HNH endonuclease [Myxococcales bacterium]
MSSFAGHATGGAARLPAERAARAASPEERSRAAENLAGNLDRFQLAVADAASAMSDAASRGDLEAWRVAQQRGTRALTQLREAAQAAVTAQAEAAEPAVAQRLAAAPALVAAVEQDLAAAAPAPEAKPPALSCEGALLAALPPDAPVTRDSRGVFDRAETAVAGVLRGQMTRTDIEAFQRLLREHAGSPIARRWRRFDAERQQRLLAILSSSKARAKALDREQAQQGGPAAVPRPAGFTAPDPGGAAARATGAALDRASEFVESDRGTLDAHEDTAPVADAVRGSTHATGDVDGAPARANGTALDRPAAFDEVDRGTLDAHESRAASSAPAAGVVGSAAEPGGAAARANGTTLDRAATFDEVDRGTLDAREQAPAPGRAALPNATAEAAGAVARANGTVLDRPAAYDEVDRGTLDAHEPTPRSARTATATADPAGAAARANGTSLDRSATFDESDRGTLNAHEHSSRPNVASQPVERAGAVARADGSALDRPAEFDEVDRGTLDAHESRNSVAASQSTTGSRTLDRPASYDESLARPTLSAHDRPVTDERLLGVLGRTVAPDDPGSSQQRVRDLLSLVESIPPAERPALRERLLHPSADDPLAVAFRSELPKGARDRILRSLQVDASAGADQTGRASSPASAEHSAPTAAAASHPDGAHSGPSESFVAPSTAGQSAGTTSVAGRESSSVSADAGHALGPEAAFLRRLPSSIIRQAPYPLILERGSRGSLAVQLASPEFPLPLAAKAISVRWRLTNHDRKAVQSGATAWVPGSSMGPLIPIALEHPADRWIEIEIDGGAAGTRRFSEMLAIQTPDLETIGRLTDDEIEDESRGLDEQIATESDRGRRETAVKGRREMEWLSFERGIAPPPEKVALMGALPTEPAAMRRHVEQLVAQHGMSSTSLVLSVRGEDPNQGLALQQLEYLKTEASAFRTTFGQAARQTADQMLDDSEAAIAEALSAYGVPFDVSQLRIVGMAMGAKGDAPLPATIEMMIRRAKKSDGTPEGDDKAKHDATKRDGLGKAAADLLALQREVHGLAEHRAQLYQQWHAEQSKKDHPSHHQPRSPEDARASVDALPPMPGGSGAPSFPQQAPDLPWEAQLALVESDLKDAKQRLAATWIQSEAEHPILAAFREGEEATAELQDVAAPDGEDALRGALATVLPKLGNIYKTRTHLGSEVDPLTLAPVVALTKQHLHVAPGTFLAGIAKEEVAKAGETGWKDYAIAAVTLGVALLGAIPTGGSSLALGAEVAGLALDAYLAVDAYDEYRTMQATSNTDLDRARSLSQEDPSLAWLAVQLVSVPVSAGFAAKTFHEAAALRRAAVGGEATSEAIAKLDRLGEEQGLGDIGSRVAREAEGGGAEAAADVTRAGVNGAERGRPLFADAVGQVAADHVDTLTRRMGVPVVVDDGLGSAVEVAYSVSESEQVEIRSLRIGPMASSADVLAHGRTLQLLRRYNGAWGRLRRLLDEILAIFRGGVRGAGSEASRAAIEAEKLQRLARMRREAMRTALESGSDTAQLLEREAQFLEAEAARFDALSQAAQRDAVTGDFTVGMPDTSHLRGGYDELANELDGVGRAREPEPWQEALGAEDPSVTGMQDVDPVGKEPHQKRLPVAKDIDPNVPPERASSGFWEDEHAKGNTNWWSDNQKVNEITHYKPIEFKDGYPVLDEYAQETVYLKEMAGTAADFGPADRELARRRNVMKSDGTPNQAWAKDYRRENGLTWHHNEDGTRMQLVLTDLHSNIPHAGGASAARDATGRPR